MNHRTRFFARCFKTSLAQRAMGVAAMAWFIVSPVPASGQPSNVLTTNQPATNPAAVQSASARPVTPPAPATAPAQGKDTWDRWNVIAAIVSALGTVAAAIAAFWSFKSAKQAETTAKAQRLSDLWPEMDKLRYLSDEEVMKLNEQAVADIVLSNVNAMEKLGLWWHADLIDRTIMAHELGTGFLDLYRQIIGLGKLEKLNRTGAELIAENPFVTELYLELPKYIAVPILNDNQTKP